MKTLAYIVAVVHCWRTGDCDINMRTSNPDIRYLREQEIAARTATEEIRRIRGSRDFAQTMAIPPFWRQKEDTDVQ